MLHQGISGESVFSSSVSLHTTFSDLLASFKVCCLVWCCRVSVSEVYGSLCRTLQTGPQKQFRYLSYLVAIFYVLSQSQQLTCT